MDPMLVAMRDIPPNPENGELFLPSDLVKEINLGTIHLKANRLCYASVVAGLTRLTVQPVDSIRVSSTHVPPNNQDSEEKTEQVLPMQQKCTWAEIVKGEGHSPKNKPEETHPQTQMSSMESQRAAGKAIPLNKQVVQPNFAKNRNGK